MRDYATVGELIPGMAYLVRRLLENTSNDSFLRSKFADNLDAKILLANPADKLIKAKADQSAQEASLNKQDKTPDNTFTNEPLCDFTLKTHREAMTLAIKKLETNLGQDVFPVISGKEIKTSEIFERKNPSQTEQTIAKVHFANETLAQEAVSEAHKAYPKWRNTPAEERSQLVEKLADLILENRYELCAIEISEVGKTWQEADGDICEAIDFCRYYAQQMRQLNTPLRVGRAKGELSLYSYLPRGVCAVIAPWNFPLAILTGMVSAALVTGNTLVMKPAEQSSLIAKRLMDLLLEAGFPKDVVQFLPGEGKLLENF